MGKKAKKGGKRRRRRRVVKTLKKAARATAFILPTVLAGLALRKASKTRADLTEQHDFLHTRMDLQDDLINSNLVSTDDNRRAVVALGEGFEDGMKALSTGMKDAIGSHFKQVNKRIGEVEKMAIQPPADDALF